MAETGDLILGAISKKSLTSTTPAITILDVYLLINVVTDQKNPDQTELFVLRACENKEDGCYFQKWNDFKPIIKDYKFTDIWYRHIYTNRNEKFLKDTENYLNKINI